ncbi:outer membrane beta-barrel protein [Shivajiella indica]|uniref:Outer membrane beta-barrel protein n=1 Tax=Shivajiella indica TaxID=872115 RepID=A0ABW5B5P3_9BACT
MQTINIRYQLYLHWRKIGFFVLGLILIQMDAYAQARFNEISKAGQDEKLISYGFFLAAHTNYYQLKYSEAFLDPNSGVGTDIESIVPVYNPGFSLGFLAILRMHDQLNLMFTPKIGFYEFKTDINFYGNPASSNSEIAFTRRTETVLSEVTMVEFPLLFKYKAQRFNNSRMFFTAGGSAMFRTKAQDEADIDFIVTTGKDFTVDLGIGFDMYFRYFKFSPEIRFSHGLNNLYRPETTDARVRDVISELRRKSITLYLHFQ